MNLTYKREDPALYMALVMVLLTYIAGAVKNSTIMQDIAFACALGIALVAMIVKQRRN